MCGDAMHAPKIAKKTCAETWLTPTDPRALMGGLLAQPEEGLAGPDDGAALMEQLASACQRILSMGQFLCETSQETRLCDKART